jgi:hypothetical protein
MNGTVLNLNQFQRACNVIKVIDSMRSRVLSLDNLDGVDVDNHWSGQHRDNHVELDGFDGLKGYATNQPGTDDYMSVTRQGSGATPAVQYRLDNNKPDAPVYILNIGDAEQAVYVNKAQGTLTLAELVGQVGGCLNAPLPADDPRVATFEQHLAALAR